MLRTVLSFCICCYSPQCSVAEAKQRCRHDWMRDALDAWVNLKGFGPDLCGEPAANLADSQGPETAPSGASLSAAESMEPQQYE